jgi:hypothetical protein
LRVAGIRPQINDNFIGQNFVSAKAPRFLHGFFQIRAVNVRDRGRAETEIEISYFQSTNRQKMN